MITGKTLLVNGRTATFQCHFLVLNAIISALGRFPQGVTGVGVLCGCGGEGGWRMTWTGMSTCQTEPIEEAAPTTVNNVTVVGETCGTTTNKNLKTQIRGQDSTQDEH
eukprot:g5711.t1